MKINVIMAIGSLCFLLPFTCGLSSEEYEIKFFLENNYNDFSNQSSSGRIAFFEEPNKIYYFDTLTKNITLVSNSSTYRLPSISKDFIAWVKGSGSASEIIMYDINGSENVQITNNSVADMGPRIYDEYLIWRTFDGNDYELILYEIESNEIIQLTNNEINDHSPRYEDGCVGWIMGDDYEKEIYLYNVSTVSQNRITEDNNCDDELIISEGNLVWISENGTYYINIYNIKERVTRTLSAGGVYQPRSLVSDAIYIGWSSYVKQVHNTEIFIYSLESNVLERFTDNSYDDSDPFFYRDLVLWSQADTNYGEIMVYNRTDESTIRLTNDRMGDYYPCVCNGLIYWKHNGPRSANIAYIVPVPQNETEAGKSIIIDVEDVDVTTRHPDIEVYAYVPTRRRSNFVWY